METINKTIKHWIMITILMVFVGTSALLSLPSVYSADAWHNSSYDMRQWINITNGSVMTDFPVFVTVTYDTDMQTNFDDVKFYDIKGTRLNYWLHNKTDSTTAWFWVNTSYDTIYMYYKNNTVAAGTSDSNGFNTFIIFDDWEDGDDSSLTVWSNGTTTGTPLNATVESFGDSNVYNITAHPNNEYGRIAGTIPTEDYVMGGSFYSLDEYDTATNYPTRIGTLEDTSNWFIVSYAQYDNDIEVASVIGGGFQGWVQHTAAANPVLADSAWFTYEIVKNNSATTTATWLSAGKDNVANLAYQGTSTNAVHDVNGSMNLFVARGTVSWDNVYVRKVMFPEPTVAFGSEESNAADNSPTTTLNNPADASYDTDGSVDFNCSCVDDINITSVALWHNGTGTWAANVTNSTSSVTFSQVHTTIDFGSSDRTVNWNCICTDNSSQTDWANANQTVLIDATSPSFNLYAPNNITYNITNLDVTEGEILFPLFLSTAECNTVLYNIDGGANSTFTSNTTLNGTIGTNQIDIYCNDSANNFALTTIYFTINNTYTITETVYPTGYHTMTGGSIGDANNDGDNEIIFGDADGNGDPELYVGYWSGSDYTFGVAASNVAGDTTSWVADIRFVDMDADGNTDILFHTVDSGSNDDNLKTTIMNFSGYVADQSNSIDWRAYYNTATENYQHGFAIGNLTGDGLNSIFIGFCGGGHYDLFNLTYTSSSRNAIYDFAATSTSAIEGDLNNDGVLTGIGTVGVWAATQQIIDFRFNSNYTLAEQTVIWTESSEGTEDLETCDLDGDGIDELVASFSYDQAGADNYVAAYKWNATTSAYQRFFVDQRMFGVNGSIHGNYTNYQASACEDLDADGKDEFIVASQVYTGGSQTVYVYMYQFDENMTATRNIIAKNTSTGWIGHRMNAEPFGDLDNDGDNELVVFRTTGYSEGHIYDGTNYMVTLDLVDNGIADTTSPEITIDNPTSGSTQTATPINLNVTVNEAANSCWFYACTPLSCGGNNTMSNSSQTNWFYEATWSNSSREEAAQFFVYCNDTTGNENYTSVTFTFDGDNPVITIVSPINQSYHNSLPIDFNVTVNEAADSCIYNLGGSNISMSNNSQTNWYIQNTTMTETLHYLTVWCNDTAGNWGSNSTIQFTYDATPPTFNWTLSNGTEAANVTTFNWRVNVSEFVGASCVFEINGTNHSGAIYDLAGFSYCTYQETALITNVTHCALFHAVDQSSNWNTTSDEICRSTSIMYETMTTTIDSPPAGNYNYDTHTLQVSTDVNADTCQYTIGPGSNITMSGSDTSWSSTIGISGTQTVTVWCQNGSLWDDASISLQYSTGGGGGGGTTPYIECYLNSDCPPEDECIDNLCENIVPECSIDADCLGDRHCNTYGYCVTNTPPQEINPWYDVVESVNDISSGNTSLGLSNQIIFLENFGFPFWLIPISIGCLLIFIIYRYNDKIKKKYKEIQW